MSPWWTWSGCGRRGGGLHPGQRAAAGQRRTDGRAVGDVIHLLAELIENGLSFSPPHTSVEVRGQMVGNGFALEIEDRGLGMSEEDLTAANRRIVDQSELNLANASRLGLYVVSRLTGRHGIRVQLKESPYGGTTAVVLIPGELVSAGEDHPSTSIGFPASGPATPVPGVDTRAGGASEPAQAPVALADPAVPAPTVAPPRPAPDAEVANRQRWAAHPRGPGACRPRRRHRRGCPPVPPRGRSRPGGPTYPTGLPVAGVRPQVEAPRLSTGRTDQRGAPRQRSATTRRWVLRTTAYRLSACGLVRQPTSRRNCGTTPRGPGGRRRDEAVREPGAGTPADELLSDRNSARAHDAARLLGGAAHARRWR